MMDTTYFGKSIGVMLFKDAHSKKNIYWKYVRHENLQEYISGINYIKNLGFQIEGIVCDGKKGLFQAFDVPVQMCQFHQAAIVRRYITKNPRMDASKELKKIMSLLPNTDKESFTGVLDMWFDKWKLFLKERTTNHETGKSFFTHKRLRSAYHSVKRNLKWLFTWYDHLELNIPNTNNVLEGTFTHLKNKLRNHNGLNLDNKKKFIDEFFQAYNEMNNE